MALSELAQEPTSDTIHTSKSFTAVAPFYDGLMAAVPYRFWGEYVVSLFRAHHINPASILDLACGTGSASMVLAGRGYRVTGVDLSPAMIEIARAKAKVLGDHIEFYAQDAAELCLDERFDAVVSLFDSLNNITEPDRLAMAFRRVYEHLASPGLFVFDLNTEVAFTAGMFNQKSSAIDGPLQYVWRSKYDPDRRICTIRMNFVFNPPNGGEMQYFEEVHRQRAYGKEEIGTMLREAGFAQVTMYDAYTHKPTKKRSDRIFVVAAKSSD